MRAVLLPQFGAATVLKYATDVPIPQLQRKSRDLLIKVRAAGVNRGDIMQRKGHYPPPKGASEIMGMEAAGVVEDVGDASGKFKVGDRVMCLLAGGGYGEYLAVHEGSCMPIPEGMSFTDAAGIPEVFLTAFQSMRINGNVQAGDTVLVHAGASGVGTAACQLAKLFGATSVTTSSEGKVGECKKFADHAVSRTPDAETKKQFAPKVIEALGGAKVNLIIDPVFGGGYLEEDAEVMAVDGKVIVLAFMGGSKLKGFSAVPLFRKRTEIKFSTLRSQSSAYKKKLVDAFTEQALGAFASKDMAPVISKVLPIQQVAEAHQEVESNATVGKIVLSFE